TRCYRDWSSDVCSSDLAQANAGAAEKQLTPLTSRGGRARPEWSPDGKWIVFLEGDEKKYGAYSMEHLTTVSADGGSAPTRLKAEIGRASWRERERIAMR